METSPRVCFCSWVDAGLPGDTGLVFGWVSGTLQELCSFVLHPAAILQKADGHRHLGHRSDLRVKHIRLCTKDSYSSAGKRPEAQDKSKYINNLG